MDPHEHNKLMLQTFGAISDISASEEEEEKSHSKRMREKLSNIFGPDSENEDFCYSGRKKRKKRSDNEENLDVEVQRRVCIYKNMFIKFRTNRSSPFQKKIKRLERMQIEDKDNEEDDNPISCSMAKT